MERGAQYATTEDGVLIAYVTVGEGVPLFWLRHYLVSHVEMEWQFPQGSAFLELSKRCRVIRFDCRGLGLSSREVDSISVEARMRDLNAVANKLGLARFALAGMQAGGNLALHYAVRHPDRVTKLILRDWAPNFATDSDAVRVNAMRLLVERDWEMFTENIGGVTFGYQSQASEGYGRLVRATLTQEMALRYGRQLLREDCYPLLTRLECETLILHSERSAYASTSAARKASALIPNARLRVFEGDLPERIDQVLAAIADFVVPPPDGAVPEAAPAPSAPLPRPVERGTLTTRELEVLQLVTKGLNNRQIAEALVLSPRTVERHLENLYRKTSTRNRAEAAAYAVANGMV